MDSFLPDAAKLIAEYAKNPNFILTCVFTWFLCEALFDIDYLEQKINGFKRITAMMVGAVIGFLIIETGPMGIIAGAIAGGLTTYAVGRLDKWLNFTGSRLITSVSETTTMPTSPMEPEKTTTTTSKVEVSAPTEPKVEAPTESIPASINPEKTPPDA